ncbi:flippase [Prevotella sp. MGM1]|uniref:flippase n=1 Tax=Prevotella sp. MGM1 TaxID=2033405 RepID=UPI000CE9F155|nr:flippase [Prevotella sp. MGM1]
MNSIKKNYIFNLLNTVTSLLFPLVTFPYASRIMLADGIGQVNFFQSIINYIVLLSSIGIPLYAIRESASVRNDKKELSRVCLEIVILHTSLTALGYLAVGIICMTVAKVTVDIPLFLLLSTTIFFNAIGCNWLFQGVEDFKYITIRGIVVRLLAILLLFVFVRTRDDLMWYAGFTVLGTVGGNVFNLWRMRRYIKPRLHRLGELRPLRHLVPSLRIFVLNLIISIYVNLDMVMLGFMKDSTAVGYYTAASKITTVLMGVVSSLGTVMLPRLSNLIHEGRMEEFNRLSRKAIDFVFTFSTPLFIGLIVLAPSLIHLFCGQSYEPAIRTLMIISPVMLIIGLSNVMGIQVLYPQRKENLVIYSTAVGAVINFSLNCLLIPKYAQDGAAIATVVAETGVTLTMSIIGAKYIPFRLFNRQNLIVILASIVMMIPCIIVRNYIVSDTFLLLLIPIIGCIIYVSIIYILGQNSIVDEVCCIVKDIRIKQIKKYKENDNNIKGA